MILTHEERQRFAQYLEIDAESSDGLAAQMDKLPGGPMQVLAKQERMYAVAARLIAKRLRSIQTESIT